MDPSAAGNNLVLSGNHPWHGSSEGPEQRRAEVGMFSCWRKREGELELPDLVAQGAYIHTHTN